MNANYIQQAQALQPWLTAHRRWLHQHPGVGFDLKLTQEYVRKALLDIGLKPVDCGRCGLIAEITGKPGETILLRADMDGLPISEETGLPFASKNGAMHACGHDLHTAMLIGAGQLLQQNRQYLNGTVRLLFQPAEEIFQGAQDVIQSGALQNVASAAMLHVVTGLPLRTGTVIVAPAGISAPAATSFTMQIHGKSCHGATPQNGVDALQTAAQILLALQDIPGRENTSGVCITVGKFNGGTASNIIAENAVLEGTMRTMEDDEMVHLKHRLSKISREIAEQNHATVSISFPGSCPTLKNDPALCGSFYKTLVTLLGKDRALSADALGGGAGGGSEDFAHISHQIPSVMLAIAAGSAAEGYTCPLHHPGVTFDEDVLAWGTAALAAFCFRNGEFPAAAQQKS